MKILLTGATGIAGLSIYRAALTDPTVSRVTLLQRREMPAWAELPPHPAEKSQTIIHKNFMEYPPDLISQLADHDACIWALGKSVAGMSEKEYTTMTYGYVMEALKALSQAGVGSDEKPFRVVFISGEGADQTEKSMMMWARVKGRTEKDLLEFCRNETTSKLEGHIIRPAYFSPSLPADKLNQRTRSYRAMDAVLKPLISSIKSSWVTPVEELALFAVELAKGRWSDEELFLNVRLRELVKTL